MLTRQQKEKQIKNSIEMLKKSKNLVFTDFSRIGVNDLRNLRTILKKAGATFKVIKKRLLKIALKKIDFDFDTRQFESQLGTIFVTSELSSVASLIYKFSKDLAKSRKEFKILGSYNLENRSFLNSDEFIIIAKLPSREILLAQLVGVLSAPIQKLLYILTELGKNPASVNTAADK